ncbi:NAD(P)H-dependent glycerol-3-phosphate dehydrogenase [Rhizosphaericola mali]|uniref:Glycerol-3-phosphate dehydrogenase n=1 Tax=Rhizosphaericola mali TaxID=2545455 RepID=A0A5P2G067_9BACT|nr:NAD(P)H-dependent glycerol-3-phosphate dehydrogenase [Rhizosphaericola mali]QES89184.1 glycerol-3-phosphate dehydrogenase [Rhizosphaericola mali]
MKIVIAGAGIFGTAIANAIKKEHNIVLYSRSMSIVEDINNNRRNTKYFPNKILSKKISASNDLHTFEDADILFLCVPSYSILSLFSTIKISKNCLVINGAKGYGNEKELIPEALSHIIPNEIISFKGPSFATEMMYELPTSFTVGTQSPENFKTVQNLFRKGLIFLDHSEDILGIELVSIIKNIYAIVIGIVDATYNSANVRFLIFTKAMKEIKMIIEHFGHSSDILFNYAGVGDFGLTSLNDLSRNRTLGLLIGKGFLNAELGNSVILEGVRSVEKLTSILAFAENLKTPLLTNLNELLQSKISNKEFLKLILN